MPAEQVPGRHWPGILLSRGCLRSAFWLVASAPTHPVFVAVFLTIATHAAEYSSVFDEFLSVRRVVILGSASAVDYWIR